MSAPPPPPTDHSSTDPSLTDPAAHGPHPSHVRAEIAARSIASIFGGSLLSVPGTHLARCVRPGARVVEAHWNYWWQAHYLDAVVDVGRRRLRVGQRSGAAGWAVRGRRLLRTIWLRNGGRWRNSYYDDMAWLALAADRLAALAADAGLPPDRWSARAVGRLTDVLRQGDTDDLGGGVFWTVGRDRKNVPASGPAAIHFARRGDRARARALLAWIEGTMRDPETGLILDSLFVDGHRDDTIYTYNQGVTLGALLEVGDPEHLTRAAELIHIVDATQRSAHQAPVLRAHGDGDGGLFTGILCRYLALAARDGRLDEEARAAAAGLVDGTADALWAGRIPRGPADATPVFSPDPATPAAAWRGAGAPLELTPQLQAWTILEAAATLR